MLTALAAARLVVTDSGGLQEEEEAWFGVPVVVLRRSTPRWEGVAAGPSELVGLDPDAAPAAVARFGSLAELKRVDALECPYGDGFAAARVADAVSEAWDSGWPRFREPDFVGRAVSRAEIVDEVDPGETTVETEAVAVSVSVAVDVAEAGVDAGAGAGAGADVDAGASHGDVEVSWK